MHKPIYSDQQRKNALERLIQNRQLVTYFQPIVDMKSQRVIGFELLNRPDQSPEFAGANDLYSFASKMNLASQLDRVCRDIGIQRFSSAAAMYEELRMMQIFVNVHTDALESPGFHSQETLGILEENGLSPTQIVFEITERGAIEDYTRFGEILVCYHEKGFRIAIDDFGTGYNSLQSIVYVNPHIIKVDRSIVNQIDNRERQQKLLEIITRYAREIGALVLAEGVERKEEVCLLMQLGVDLAQGYYFGPPTTEIGRFRHLLMH
ncbi:MAG: hypothetical protein BAA01_00415 [Bacillus thermozeamaize]|mgnify:CR=1 FL=1|uniref:EAL domain-containing protein n=1 Tax=Bacillus thermozeamaize TaxID=230954 RepID=A0A1Y3PXL7_9BACI|nr:MAG: hypothetical protein BAA01_00415 [Bacillus thermozeamaize]